MDSRATNYWPVAQVDDGTCTQLGCTDSTRSNYNPGASYDDGSCAPVYWGCTEPKAANFLAAAHRDDGSCSIPGCMDASDVNFSPAATFDDATCQNQGDRRHLKTAGILATSASSPPDDGPRGRRLAAGCMDPKSMTFSAAATSHDSAMCNYFYAGCMDADASNYLPFATTDTYPTSCIYPIFGCPINDLAISLNYDPDATMFKPGSCQWSRPGCTDPLSAGFEHDATYNDGSCTYPIFGCTDPTASNYNLQATVTLGCLWSVSGCADSYARNFAPDVSIHTSGSCTYAVPGCTVKGALNYDSTANTDDGTCIVAPAAGIVIGADTAVHSPPPPIPPTAQAPHTSFAPSPSVDGPAAAVDDSAAQAGQVTLKEDEEGSGGGMVIIAAAGAGGGVVLIALVALVVCCIRRRRTQGDDKAHTPRIPSPRPTDPPKAQGTSVRDGSALPPPSKLPTPRGRARVNVTDPKKSSTRQPPSLGAGLPPPAPTEPEEDLVETSPIMEETPRDERVEVSPPLTKRTPTLLERVKQTVTPGSGGLPSFRSTPTYSPLGDLAQASPPVAVINKENSSPHVYSPHNYGRSPLGRRDEEVSKEEVTKFRL